MDGDGESHVYTLSQLMHELRVERDFSYNLQLALNGWVKMMTHHGLIRNWSASYVDMRKEAEQRLMELKALAYPKQDHEDDEDE